MPAIDVICRLHRLWDACAVDDIPQVCEALFVAHMPKGWARSSFGSRAVCRSGALTVARQLGLLPKRRGLDKPWA